MTAIIILITVTAFAFSFGFLVGCAVNARAYDNGYKDGWRASNDWWKRT